MNRGHRTHSNVLIGLILVVIGVLLLLGRFDVVDFGDFISTWWPMILVIIGLAKMTTPGAPRFGAGFLIFAIGIILQLIELDVLSWRLLSYLWPLIIIIIGLKIILSPRGWHPQHSTNTTKDRIDTVALFGGTKLAVTSQDFKGGQATAIFGGVEIDLRGSKLSGGMATLHATALFGGVDIRVPDNWQIHMEGTPLFGSLESKCKAPESPDAPRLIIKGSAIFGGVEAKQ